MSAKGATPEEWAMHHNTHQAIAAWWNRPTFEATWDPDEGVPAFRKKFDPRAELGDLTNVFIDNGDELIITWGRQVIRLSPGQRFLYRQRRS